MMFPWFFYQHLRRVNTNNCALYFNFNSRYYFPQRWSLHCFASHHSYSFPSFFYLSLSLSLSLTHTHTHTHALFLYIYEVHTICFKTFFVWALLLIKHTWNCNPLRSNLLRLQCTGCTVPTTSRACQWPSWQCLSSPECLIRTASELREKPKVTGSKVCTIGRVRNCFGAYLGRIVCDKDGVVEWRIVRVEMILTRFEECWPLPTEALAELP